MSRADIHFVYAVASIFGVTELIACILNYYFTVSAWRQTQNYQKFRNLPTVRKIIPVSWMTFSYSRVFSDTLSEKTYGFVGFLRYHTQILFYVLMIPQLVLLFFVFMYSLGNVHEIFIMTIPSGISITSYLYIKMLIRKGIFEPMIRKITIALCFAPFILGILFLIIDAFSQLIKPR